MRNSLVLMVAAALAGGLVAHFSRAAADAPGVDRYMVERLVRATEGQERALQELVRVHEAQTRVLQELSRSAERCAR